MGEVSIQKDDLVTSSIQIDGSEITIESIDDFSKSYARGEYLHVLTIIGRIIERMEKIRKDKKKKEYTYSPGYNIHNIVPIFGGRGTGKSSILYSVAGALARGVVSQDEREYGVFDEFFAKGKGKFDSKSFIVLDTIDGSLLERNEDIFSAILAQLFQKLREQSSPAPYRYENYGEGLSSRLQNLKKNFEKLYISARQIGKRDDEDIRLEELTPLSSLNTLSDSLRLRQEFKKLISSYTEFISTNKNISGKDVYIVVPIDDLDLNIDSGYEMLEQIHRYMMVPNIIILMAIDQNQLKRLVEKHFFSMIPTFDSKMNSSILTVDQLSSQYLEKVMPLDYRTHVRSFLSHVETYVTIKQQIDDNNRQEEQKYSIKHIVFRLLNERIGMRMDMGGVKRHIFERETLRTFVNFINLLYAMKNPFEKKDDDAQVRSIETYNIETFQYNYTVLKREILQGLVTTTLHEDSVLTLYNVAEAAYISTFIGQPQSSMRPPLSAKAKFDTITKVENTLPHAFRNLYHLVITEGARAFEGGNLRELAEDLSFYGYSYGEILHIIYEYGRIDNENKDLIRCLLAYYSLELYRSFALIQYYKSNLDKEKLDREIGYFRHTINGSIIGSWANSMVPFVRSYPRVYQSGYRKIPSSMEKIFRIKVTNDFLTRIKTKADIRRFIRAILIIGSFFDCPNYKLPEMIKWKSSYFDENNTNGKKNANDETYDIKNDLRRIKNARKEAIPIEGDIVPIESGEGTFSFFNFVSNAFQLDNFKCLCMYLKSYCNTFFDEKHKNSIEKMIDKELVKEIESWHDKYCGFALPLYDIDICYNLFKRLLQDMYGKSDVVDDRQDIFECYLDAYTRMAKRLKENDEAYKEYCKIDINDGDIQINAARYSFYQAFCSCPYMMWLGIDDGNGTPTEEQRKQRDMVRELFAQEVFFTELLHSGIARKDRRVKSLLDLSGYYD